MLTGEQPGYAYSRIDNPTVVALGDAVAELHGAEAGIALATGMAAIHAALPVDPAGRRPAAHRPGGLRDDADAGGRPRSGGSGVDVAYVDTTDVAAVEAALAARPTRILHVETIANPTCVVADLPGPRRGRPPPRGAADGRQHVRLARGLPAARARRGPRDGVGDEVPLRPLRRDGRRGRRLARARSPRCARRRSTPARRSGRSPRSSSCAGSRRSRCGSSARRGPRWRSRRTSRARRRAHA